MKKVLLALICISLVICSMASALTDIDNYPDDYKNAISTLSQINVISGYPDGTFKGEKTVTRAELAKMLVTFFELDGDIQMIVDFSDVSNHWAKSYIDVAVLKGIVKGYDDHTFKPENTVTYGECAAMIVRLIDNSVEQGTGKAWSEPYMKFLSDESGISDGIMTNDFIATNGARRDNVAFLLYRASLYLDSKKEVVPVETKPAEPTLPPVTSTPTSTPKATKEPESTDSPLESNKMYVGKVTLEKQKAGIDYVCLDVYGVGAIEFEVKKISKKPVYNSLVVFKTDSSSKVKILKELKLSAIDGNYFTVDAREGSLISFVEDKPMLDLELDKYTVGSKTYRLDRFEYILAEMVDEKGTFVFSDAEVVKRENLHVEKYDKFIFDGDSEICFILRGYDVEEE